MFNMNSVIPGINKEELPYLDLELSQTRSAAVIAQVTNSDFGKSVNKTTNNPRQQWFWTN